MKLIIKSKSIGFLTLLLVVMSLFVLLQSNEGNELNYLEIEIDTSAISIGNKSNVYIDSESEVDLSGGLSFPKVEKAIESIAEYDAGLDVSVKPTCLIDGKYHYFFYESIHPEIWRPKYGWVVKQENLIEFLMQSIGNNGINAEIDTCSQVHLYKPNVYIYPLEVIDLSVIINFPQGGRVTESIPEYGNGWNVMVDTSSLIDNKYHYLYYESKQPDVWQNKYGWVINQENLTAFFDENMRAYGFNEREIKDFIEYWIPRLKEYPYYSICPQTNGLIETVVELEFSLNPENILRLYYDIEGLNNKDNKLLEPQIDSFKREGYYITEWGVII